MKSLHNLSLGTQRAGLEKVSIARGPLHVAKGSKSWWIATRGILATLVNGRYRRKPMMLSMELYFPKYTTSTCGLKYSFGLFSCPSGELKGLPSNSVTCSTSKTSARLSLFVWSMAVGFRDRGLIKDVVRRLFAWPISTRRG